MLQCNALIMFAYGRVLCRGALQLQQPGGLQTSLWMFALVWSFVAMALFYHFQMVTWLQYLQALQAMYFVLSCARFAPPPRENRATTRKRACVKN